MHNSEFKLPPKIGLYIAILADYYKSKNQNIYVNVLKNSNFTVIPDVERYTDFGEEEYGHNIIFSLSKELFVDIIDEQRDIRKEIASKLNESFDIPNEFIHEVYFEPTEIVHTPFKQMTEDADLQRIWGSDGVKIFLSHKSTYKKQTASIKHALGNYGISCFVAHEDIRATEEWQPEIERALFSMDVFIALLADDFHVSQWTDQEVGVAIGRGIHVIPIKIDHDPQGFLSKLQAIKINTTSNDWPQIVAKGILKLLLNRNEFKEKLQESILSKFETVKNYAEGHDATTTLLPLLSSISRETASRIAHAFNENTQLWRASAVCNTLPNVMKKLTGEEYYIEDKQLISESEKKAQQTTLTF